MRKSRNILKTLEAFPNVPCTQKGSLITVLYPLTSEKGFIKLLPLSNYSQDHSWMEGSPDYLAVSHQFQKCSFTPSALIRTENKTPQASVL